jgi:hypothetical protein
MTERLRAARSIQNSTGMGLYDRRSTGATCIVQFLVSFQSADPGAGAPFALRDPRQYLNSITTEGDDGAVLRR